MMRMPTGPGDTGKVMEDAEREASARDEEIELAHELTEGGPPAEGDGLVPADLLRTDPAAAAALIRGRRQYPLPKQADPAAPLLAVRDLKTHFKLSSGWVKAVDGVSFRLNDGEALGLAGESGCGKTTTALSLVRLLPGNASIRSGSIDLFGIDLVPKTEAQLRRYRWREISIVFQGAMNALNPVQRIGDQIAEPIEIRLGESQEQARKRSAELLELVGIPRKRAKAYPHELSGGMRQRAMIAMALACDPAIVIGDEPTTALDVMVQAQILELLERLRRDLGLSLILITHDLSVIAETCDRTLIMYAGKVAEEGPVSRIFSAPRHPYTQKLLGAFPNIHADRRSLETIPGSPPDLLDPPPGCRFHPRCPAAMDVCREVVPPEVVFADGVRVACHLYPADRDGAVAVTSADVVARGPAVGTALPVRRSRGGGRPVSELVRVDGLEVHFPIRAGLVDTLARRPKAYVRAVDGIDLTIERGEVLALVGESGSGKTTTGRVIVKLTHQTAGRVTFDGRDVTDVWGGTELRDYRRRVQLIFQDPYETLNPKQTIHDFVAEPLDVNNLVKHNAEREERVLAAIDSAGLRPAREFAFRYPHELSGGQRQRVVIAGAMVMGPELVVADEPVSMLDVSIRTELLRLMLDLRSERNLTYLFITHDLSLAWVISDRIAVMYLGKIMEIGPAEAVIKRPHHPYTKALVGVSPTPDPADAAARNARYILVGETPDAAAIPSGCRFHPRCPLAFERCSIETPPLFDIGDGQQAACWLAEGGRDLPDFAQRSAGRATATAPSTSPPADVASPVDAGAPAAGGPPVAEAATSEPRDAAQAEAPGNEPETVATEAAT